MPPKPHTPIKVGDRVEWHLDPGWVRTGTVMGTPRDTDQLVPVRTDDADSTAYVHRSYLQPVTPPDVIGNAWTQHPHDTITSVAAALPRLLRILTTGTRAGNPRRALAHTEATSHIVSSLIAACEVLPQLLTHLSQAMQDQADNPTLHDDRTTADPATTAEDSAAFLKDAAAFARALAGRLTDAARCASHLSNPDPVPAVSEQEEA